MAYFPPRIYPLLPRVNHLRKQLGLKPLKGWRRGYHAINTYRITLERKVKQLEVQHG